MNNEDIPLIKAAGSPYEVGLAHGKQAKVRIVKCIETYSKKFFSDKKIDWNEAKEIAQTYLEPIQAYEPSYIVEMQGIADGAGVDFLDILTINSRSELLFGLPNDAVPDGCTSVAVTCERTENNTILIGQNWDWNPEFRDTLIVLDIKTENKPELIIFTEAGMIGKMGISAAGMTVCLNALSFDSPPTGVPLMIALRCALEQYTISEAIRVLTSVRIGSAGNIMLAHKDGEAIDIELAGDDFAVIYPQNGILVHANHYISGEVPRYPHRDTMRKLSSSSFIRYNRAKKLLHSIEGCISINDIKKVFRDHADYPHSICSHVNPRLPNNRYFCTLASILMNPAKMEFEICASNPCMAEYKTIDISHFRQEESCSIIQPLQ